MDVSAVQSLYGTAPTVSTEEIKKAQQENNNAKSFSTVFDSVMGLVDETNTLQNQAEASAIQFALGESDNMHDLLVAQTKANTALQYTVAVRDKMIEAYQQIMQMQI